jgi:hypothetical protein
LKPVFLATAGVKANALQKLEPATEASQRIKTKSDPRRLLVFVDADHCWWRKVRLSTSSDDAQEGVGAGEIVALQ